MTEAQRHALAVSIAINEPFSIPQIEYCLRAFDDNPIIVKAVLTLAVFWGGPSPVIDCADVVQYAIERMKPLDFRDIPPPPFNPDKIDSYISGIVKTGMFTASLDFKPEPELVEKDVIIVFDAHRCAGVLWWRERFTFKANFKSDGEYTASFTSTTPIIRERAKWWRRIGYSIIHVGYVIVRGLLWR